MKVVIDGIEYVPRVEHQPPSDPALRRALRELVLIQYFSDQEHKHRAWAWDALNALDPNLAELCSQDASAAWYLTHHDEEG